MRQPIDSELEVEREAGAEMCPDAAAVFRSLARLFPERTFRSAEAASATASARVVIRALPTGYEAALSMRRPHPGERVLLEKDEDCAGLADALALAFMLLVEPPAPAAPPPVAPPPVAPPPVASPPVAPPEAIDSRGPSTRATTPAAHSFTGNIAASGIGGFGLLSKPAAGVAVGVELFHRSGWGGSLDGVRLWSPASDAAGGSVRLSVWALLGGPCYGLALGRGSSLDACVRLGAGSQYAKVHGFVAPNPGSFPWVVVAPTIGYRLAAAKLLSGFVRVGPVAQLLPQSFSAQEGDGSGVTVHVARAPNVGVMAELGLLTGGAGL